MNQKLSEQLSDFLTLLTQAQKDYSQCQEEIIRLDQLTQDYLHMLELQTTGYHDRARIAEALRRCRMERRQHKDTVSVLEPLVNHLGSERGKTMISQLQQVLGAVRKAEKTASGRRYTPRVLSPEEYGGKLK